MIDINLLKEYTEKNGINFIAYILNNEKQKLNYLKTLYVATDDANASRKYFKRYKLQLKQYSAIKTLFNATLKESKKKVKK